MMAFGPSASHTVASLRAARGRHAYAMLRVETLDEAAAAEAAGVELLSVPPAMMLNARFREVAPDAFCFPGDNFYEIGGPDDFLRWALPLIKHGADGVYCSGSLATVRLLADHAIPVCGHVGLIPSKRTWTGGFRAVGKALDQAKWVWDACVALEEAGAFAAEIEVVPAAITAAIAARTSLFMISMGAGGAGHAQYLFSDDVLGQNRGHVPRHAKVYSDLASEQDRLQGLRVQAMSAFAADVHTGAYPSVGYLVKAEAEVVTTFTDWLAAQTT
jgi:3-methyl-2-oxobutanoate hydroxymethyltransferase